MTEQEESFQAELKIGGQKLRLQGAIPTEPISIIDLLPLIQRVADAVGDVALHEVKTSGKQLSCQAGCGACCRQLVPISEPEAVYLAQLVDAMPAEKQELIRGRLSEAREKLEQHGMLEALRMESSTGKPETRREFGQRYFELGIPCPFLENESCSIHAHRPISCREYLVTSPAVDCADPVAQRVEMVVIPRSVSSTLYRFGDGEGHDKAHWLPLILALEWAEQHTEQSLPLFPGAKLFENFIRQFASSKNG